LVGVKVSVGVGWAVAVALGIEILLTGALVVSAGILQPAERLTSMSPKIRGFKFIFENITEGVSNVNTHGGCMG
jgi:hypothetical protein